MINIRPSKERGSADYGWLKTSHTFSFADYHDPKYMGFHSLRVINEDHVAPNRGFDLHPHRDMEIMTYVVSGALKHEDSMGNGSIIQPGDVQIMSAGTGVRHSEKNPSKDFPVHLLQIWILPEKMGLTPRYDQKAFSRDEKNGQLCLLVSHDGRDGSLKINQDACVYGSLLEAGAKINYKLNPGRHLWIQVVEGRLAANGRILNQGDGAAVSDESNVLLTSDEDAEVLVFDLK